MTRPSVFLDSLPVPVRARLDALARQCAFNPGAVIFHEGDAHGLIHIVKSGCVRLEMNVPRRGRMPILTVAAGELLGWSPLFGDHAMTATAIAMEPVQTMAFDGSALRAFCESDHEAGFWIMRQLALALSQRLLATRLHLLDLFLEQTPVSQPSAAVSMGGPLP